MSDNLFEIDSAMNMIKEDIIKDLSESVSEKNNKLNIQGIGSKIFPFSEGGMD